MNIDISLAPSVHSESRRLHGLLLSCMQLANSNTFILAFTDFTKHLTGPLTWPPDIYTACWSIYKTAWFMFWFFSLLKQNCYIGHTIWLEKKLGLKTVCVPFDQSNLKKLSLFFYSLLIFNIILPFGFKLPMHGLCCPAATWRIRWSFPTTKSDLNQRHNLQEWLTIKSRES
jgi:hypothetical protein